VVHVILECVFEALARYGTGAQIRCAMITPTPSRGKNVQWVFAALTICHHSYSCSPLAGLSLHSSDTLCDELITKGSFVHKPMVTILLTDCCKPFKEQRPKNAQNQSLEWMFESIPTPKEAP